MEKMPTSSSAVDSVSSIYTHVARKIYQFLIKKSPQVLNCLKTTPVLKVPADSSKWNEISVLTLFDIEVKTRALVNTADTGNQA